MSTSGAVVIVALGAMLVLSTVAGVGGNVAERVSEANAAFLEDEVETLRTDVAITEAEYHYDGTYMSVTIENTGSRSIHLSDTDLVLDGTYRRATIADVLAIGEFQRTVGGSPATDILLPGESLHLEWETERSDRLVVVTEHGVANSTKIEIVQDATIIAPRRDRAHVETKHTASIVAIGDMDGEELDTFELNYSNAPSVGVSDVDAGDIEAEANGTDLTVDSVDVTSQETLVVNFDGSYTLDLGEKVEVNVSNVTNPNSSGSYDVPITITAEDTLGNTDASETDPGKLRIDPAPKAMLYADDTAAGATTTHDAYFEVESGDSIVGDRYTQFAVDYAADTNADLSNVDASDVEIEIDRDGDGEVDYNRTPNSIDTAGDSLNATFPGDAENRPVVEAGDVLRLRVADVQNPSINDNHTVPITVLAAPEGEVSSQDGVTSDASLLIPGVSSWPTFGFDAENTGHGDTLFGPTSGDAERWSTATSGEVQSAPAVITTAFTGDFDAVYVGSDDGSFRALWTSNGTVRWTYGTGAKVRSGPAIANDTIYVGSNDGTVYALDRETGSEKWTFDTAGKVKASPTVVGETVYVGSLDTDVYALNATTGEKRWEFETEGEIHTTPAHNGSAVVVASKGEKTVYSLDADDGSVEWQRNLGAETLGGVAINDSRVYVGTSGGTLFALHTQNGSTDWSYDDAGTMGAVVTSPAVAGGTVFVGDTNGYGYAVDGRTGSEEWATGPAGGVHSSPAFVSDTVYVGTDDGTVYALDAADGSQRWSFSTGGAIRSAPAVTNGVVYVGSNDGSVYAIWEP